MSDSIPNQDEQPGEMPSTQRAADDLREAAGVKTRQTAQSAEERAQLLKESAAEKAQKFRDLNLPTLPERKPPSSRMLLANTGKIPGSRHGKFIPIWKNTSGKTLPNPSLSQPESGFYSA